MVLTVPGIAIIDGPGYYMSYGEATKRASEASVLNATTLPRQPDGAGSICDANWLGAKFLTSGLEESSSTAGNSLKLPSSVVRGKARRLRDKGRKLEHGNPDWSLGPDPS
jgi:hypothetical protein